MQVNVFQVLSTFEFIVMSVLLYEAYVIAQGINKYNPTKERF